MAKRAKKATAALNLTLNQPSASVDELKILLYGREGAGKTTFALQFPSAYIFFFEPGEGDDEFYGMYPTSWEQFTRAVKELEKQPQFRTIVIDTAELCYGLCFDYVCKKKGFAHPSEEDYGGGWNEIRREWVNVIINGLMKLGRGVIFISHEKERKIQNRRGGSRSRIHPALSGQARDVLTAAVKLVVHYDIRAKDKHVLTLVGDDVTEAKNRYRKRFQGITEIPAGDSPETAYKRFCAAFDGKSPWKKSGRKKAQTSGGIRVRRKSW